MINRLKKQIRTIFSLAPHQLHFLVIGAQKSGTTALDRYLRKHPQIGLPPNKELHFFDTPNYFDEPFPTRPIINILNSNPIKNTAKSPPATSIVKNLLAGFTNTILV